MEASLMIGGCLVWFLRTVITTCWNWQDQLTVVTGDYDTSNSKRSELAGFGASLELLLMFAPWLEISPTDSLQVQTWIESSGAGLHLSNLLGMLKKRRCLMVSARPKSDTHFQWLWSCLLRIKHNFSLVKGHQHSSQPCDTLPKNAQLNVLADVRYSISKVDLNKDTYCPALCVRTYRIRIILNPIGLGLSTGSMGWDQRDTIGL